MNEKWYRIKKSPGHSSFPLVRGDVRGDSSEMSECYAELFFGEFKKYFVSSFAVLKNIVSMI